MKRDHRTPENFNSVLATANAFQSLGVAPLLGRTILPSDVGPDGQPQPAFLRVSADPKTACSATKSAPSVSWAAA